MLTNKAYDRRDLRDSGYGLKRLTDLPVLQTSQIGEIEIVAPIDQQVFVDPTGSSGVGTDDGVDSGRELARELLHVFKHAAARPIDVSAILEDDEHVRVVEHGLRANRLHM